MITLCFLCGVCLLLLKVAVLVLETVFIILQAAAAAAAAAAAQLTCTTKYIIELLHLEQTCSLEYK